MGQFILTLANFIENKISEDRPMSAHPQRDQRPGELVPFGTFTFLNEAS
jgi:carotenoid cleavage dioxygenase-like enzyme